MTNRAGSSTGLQEATMGIGRCTVECNHAACNQFSQGQITSASQQAHPAASHPGLVAGAPGAPLEHAGQTPCARIEAMMAKELAAKERDGTIPLSEALAAIDRGESVEAQFMEDGAWNKLTRDYRVAIGCLTQPSTRFRLAPPSRLRSVVDNSFAGRPSGTFAGHMNTAQAVTRDIIAFVNSPTCAGRDNEAIAGAIEHVYLGSK